MSETWQLQNGDILYNVHSEEICRGRNCSIHNPSLHPLRNATLFWENGMAWRICSEGVAHPDPDEIRWRLRTFQPVQLSHRCCDQNCCGMRSTPEDLIDHLL